ncbi:putative ribonuclease III [Bacteriovorax sp. DB6_IX]|nr:putative ribonuclease III [Bacteriovorax sp. DB6_IX]
MILIICDVFEALIGAVTIDTDMNRAYELLQHIIGEYESFSRSAFIDEKKLYLFDPKSTLQELTMREYKTLPEYRAKSIEEGFLVELHINDKKVDEIIGHSKKQLQKELALRYLNFNFRLRRRLCLLKINTQTISQLWLLF